MKTTINLYEFREAFQEIRPNNFSYEGLEVLFDYLEECENDLGEEYEFDVIALCCDFSEDSVDVIAEQYSIDVSGLTSRGKVEKVEEYLQDEGVLVGATDLGFVYRQF